MSVKIVKYVLLPLAITILISSASFVYYQARLFYWFESHRPTQGMPLTVDMEVAYYLAQPAFFIRELL